MLRLALLLMAAVALAGCEGGPLVTSGNSDFARKAPQRVAVADRSVIIAGPRGYCIDTSAIRESDSGVFVLLGSCASIARNINAGSPATPGLLTASVSGGTNARIGTSLDQLQAFFSSDEGRRALSRDGRAETVTILETRRSGDAFYIHARDTSSNSLANVADDYWRGLFDVRDRIVTVTVVAFENRPVSAERGLATLDAFADRILSENRASRTVTGQ